MRLKLKHKLKSETKRPIDIIRLKDPIISKRFQIAISNRYDPLRDLNGQNIDEKWRKFKDNLIECANKEIGRRRGKNRERWIQQPTWKLIDRRKQEKQKRDQTNDEALRREIGIRYRVLDKQVKRSCRRDRREWFEERGKAAQDAASRNDQKTLYRIVRELSNTNSNNSNVPVKDTNGNVLVSDEDQEIRWVEHFKSVLNQSPPIDPFIIEKATQDNPLSIKIEDIKLEEVKQVITSLKRNKAPGSDEISSELLKHGGKTVTVWLTNLLNEMCRNGKVPLEWRSGVIVKVPKKGNLSDCNNWRGITLLSVPGKVFCKVLLNRLKDIDVYLREEQAGFRSGRSCSEQIFTLRNIVEQSLEFQTPLYVNYIDFKKDFDSIHRPSLWRITAIYGVLQQYIGVFKSLYDNTSCCIRSSKSTSPPFDILSGVKQGCILSPFLFPLVLDFVLKKSLQNETFGLPWGSERLCDLDFADDIALLTQKKDSLQEMTNSLEHHGRKVGLQINANKTKTMSIATSIAADTTLYTVVLK